MNMYGKRNGGGGNKYSCLNPDGIETFKPIANKGKNRINILTYQVGSDKHPLVRSGDIKVGSKDWQLTWFEHRNIGPDQRTLICNKRTYGGKCTACDARKELMDAGGDKNDLDVKALTATERTAMLVQYVNEAGIAQVGIFVASSFQFTVKLLQACGEDEMAKDFDSNQVEFADFGTDGRIVEFKYHESGTGRAKQTSYDSFAFAKREGKNMTPAVAMLEDLPSIDKWLKVVTPAEFSAIFNAQPVEAEEAEPGDADADAEEQAPPPKAEPVKPKLDTKPVPVEDDENNPPVISENPDEPVRPAKPTLKAAVKPVAEPEDDTPLCPMRDKGGKFGETADSYTRCLKCVWYEKCCAANG